ncbi:MAG: molybdenum cofactor guanylyltransferase [Spirochaetota bacterium]
MLFQKHSSINAFILAGGKSSRIDTDKAFLKYRGKYFIDIISEGISTLFEKIYLIGKDYHNRFLAGSYVDEIEGIGPLGGIYTALKKTDKQINFITGTDYPFIDPEIIAYLINEIKDKSKNYHALVPVMPDGPHPLCAFYKRACLPAITRCIDEGNNRVLCIARYTPLLYYDMIKESRIFSPEKLRRNFININSNEDYLRYVSEFQDRAEKL